MEKTPVPPRTKEDAGDSTRRNSMHTTSCRSPLLNCVLFLAHALKVSGLAKRCVNLGSVPAKRILFPKRLQIACSIATPGLPFSWREEKGQPKKGQSVRSKTASPPKMSLASSLDYLGFWKRPHFTLLWLGPPSRNIGSWKLKNGLRRLGSLARP